MGFLSWVGNWVLSNHPKAHRKERNMRGKGEQGNTETKTRALLLWPVTGQGWLAEDEQEGNGELRAAPRLSSEQAREYRNE